MARLAVISAIVTTYGNLGEDKNMKTFIVACLAAIVIAVIGGVVLTSIQEPVDKAFSTGAVRLGA